MKLKIRKLMQFPLLLFGAAALSLDLLTFPLFFFLSSSLFLLSTLFYIALTLFWAFALKHTRCCCYFQVDKQKECRKEKESRLSVDNGKVRVGKRKRERAGIESKRDKQQLICIKNSAANPNEKSSSKRAPKIDKSFAKGIKPRRRQRDRDRQNWQTE